MSDDRFSVSFVLGTRDRLAFLQAAIRSIRLDAEGFDHEIIVVDGGSVDGTREWLASLSGVQVICQEEHLPAEPSARPSWGAFMNLGFRAARHPHIFMISDDCLVVPGTLAECARIIRAEMSPIGGVAVPWRNWPEDDAYLLGRTFGDYRFINHGVYLRRALEEVGWVDETTYGFYHADGDLSLRVQRAGWPIVDCVRGAVEHFRHANLRLRRQNNLGQQRDWAAYEKRWGALGPPRVAWDRIAVRAEAPDALPFEYWGRQRALRARLCLQTPALRLLTGIRKAAR